MTSKFFRFLSRNSSKPDSTNNKSNHNNNSQTHSTALNLFGADAAVTIPNNKHVKLNEVDSYNEKMLNKINDLSKKSTRNSKFFSFRSKTKYKQSLIDKNGQCINAKDAFQCSITFLDGTQELFCMSKKEMAAKLYEKVFYHLDLVETDYFGLQYCDGHNIKHWLDPSKLIKKQCKIGPPFQFFFKVTFKDGY